MGLVDEEVWTRKGGVPVVNRRRPFVEKESHRWLRSCEQAAERLKGARSITMVSDAESDIYELFAGLPQGLQILVRVARDRRLENGDMLSQSVENLTSAGTILRTIPAAP